MLAYNWPYAVTRWGPAVFFTAVAVFYTIRILLFTRRHHRSPIGYGRPGTEQRHLYLVFRVFRVLIWSAMLARAVWPPFDAWLVPLPVLATPAIMLAGNAVMVGSFALVLRQHMAMGSNWRSGLADPADGLPLLTQRPYTRSRHPMFATVMLAQIGLFLAVPSLFTLLCLGVGITTLVRQARLEERQMALRHGADWLSYSASRRRWPWSRRPGWHDGGGNPVPPGHGSVT